MSTWTPEREAMVRKLWQDGWAASAIAKKLGGVTRNAVIGIVHRRGWKERERASDPNANIKYRPGEVRRRPNESRDAKRDLRKLAPAPACKPPRPARQFGTSGAPLSGCKPPRPVVEAVVPDNVVRLAEPTAHTCKWPLGDPAANDFGWCAHPKQAGSPYCAQHTRAAYVTPPKPANSGRRADPSRELERALRRWL